MNIFTNAKVNEQQSDNLHGAAITMGTAFAFTVNDTLMKEIVSVMSPYQALCLRGLMVMPLIIALAWAGQQINPPLTSAHRRLLFHRTWLEILLAFCVLNALAHLTLALVVVVFQAVPLCLTFYAALFLGEQVGWRRWSAITLGFIGVLIVVQPGTAGFDANIFYALGTVVCLTARDLLTRRMPRKISALHTVLWTSAGTCLFGGALIPLTDWTTLGGLDYIFLAASSLTILLAYWLSVVMMRIGDVGFVSQFRYTGVLWAIGFGFVFFDEIPSAPTLIGAAIIVSSGTYSIYREHKLARLARAADEELCD